MHSQEGYFGVIFSSSEAIREINTKINLKQTHKSMSWQNIHYSISHMMWWAHKWWSKDNFHISTLCLTRSAYFLMMMSQLIVQWQWWCHNWLGVCDADTWILISNSLDISFSHGDFHSQSCIFHQTISFVSTKGTAFAPSLPSLCPANCHVKDADIHFH